MARKLKGLQILVGNRLDDGRAVFFNKSLGWVADVRQASAAEAQSLATLIEQANQHIYNNEIAGFEPVEAVIGVNGTAPVHGKPLMQSKGPSVRTDLGYQTGLTWETA